MVTVDAQGASRVFYVSPEDDDEVLDVTITGLTITGGSTTNSGGGLYFDGGAGGDLSLARVVITGNTAEDAGGGLYFTRDSGDFTLFDSVVSDNDAGGRGGGLYLRPDGAVLISGSVISGNTAEDGGGGIYMETSPEDASIVNSAITGNTAYDGTGGGLYATWFESTDTGALTIERTTIADNTAYYSGGGGLKLTDLQGEVVISNSTISGNESTDSDGGGLYVEFSSGFYVPITIEHSTIVDNSAAYGGGISVASPLEATLDHTIVANNTATYLGPDIFGSFDVRFSLVEDPSDATVTDLGGNLAAGTDPKLLPLAPNGDNGIVQTHLPLPASPVLNAGDPAFGPPPTTDQRGRLRVALGRIDIGAVERQANRKALPGLVTQSTTWRLRDSLTTGEPLPGQPTIGPFIYGTKPLVPFMGDWNGDGVRTPGTFEKGTFRLNNQNDGSAPDIVFTFGDTHGYPVAGDWDGDGDEEVALYRNGVWNRRPNTNPGSVAGTTFNFGPVNTWPNVTPVAGDWNGDGIDGIGTYTASGTWSLRQTATGGAANAGSFFYQPGPVNASFKPAFVGDWDGDGDDTVGIRNGTTWMVKNTNNVGAPDITFDFATDPTNELPVVWGTK